MKFSYRRLEHDLDSGYRLLLLKIQHGADGFRGHAKGKGFRAYLEAEKIPVRRAYRLIRRYQRVRAIWDRVNVANAELLNDVFPPEEFKKIMEGFARLAAQQGDAMCDGDRVTNVRGENT